MKKYLYLQSKRIFRYLPGAALVVLVLLGGLLAAFTLMTGQNAQSEDNQKYKIAISGDTQDAFLQMGLTALQTFDSTSMSMEILQMEEKEAADALTQGQIAAYVVIPENFVDQAMRGENLTMRFVSTTGASGMVSMMKEEITKVVALLMLEAQKGYFGLEDGLRDQHLSTSLADDLPIQYVEQILLRDRVYRLEELGISDRLGLEGYLLCGLSVLFLMLCCLPFAPLMLRSDPALGRMLAAKGKKPWMQAVCDFAAYLLGLVLILILVLVLASIAKPDQIELGQLLQSVMPVLVLVASFSFMLYSVSSDLISGVLLQFFVTVAICFVSGCMYPVYFFPESVQKLAAWLPAGVARAQLSGYFTGSVAGWATAALWLYCAVFFAVGAACRIGSIRRKQG